MIINSLIEICVRCFWQSLESLRGYGSLMPATWRASACSKVTSFFSMNVRNSSVALAWIWLLYLAGVIIDLLRLSAPTQDENSVRPFVVMASEMETKRQKCGFLDLRNKVLNHNCLADHLNID